MARVADLSVEAQQRVEIVKALYRQARVLILDEPTAVLAPAEARDLWAATERLAAAGTTIVFITHKLDEVMAHADHVTVLRRGRRVYDSPIKDTTPEILARQMIGTTDEATEPIQAVSPAESRAVSPAGEVVISLRDVTVRGRRGETTVEGAALDVRAGEIVGLAGVDGSGQVELIEAVMGLRPTASGTVSLAGRDLTGLSVAARRMAGIGYVPEDRHHRALALSFSCEENAVLGRHREPEFARGGWLRTSHLRAFLQEKIQAFDVRGASVGLPARSLSGGNQQKLVLARELSRQPRLLLASQPTRGLDFAATAFVHNALRAERDRGAAVLVQSLDLDEVLTLSDRVAVMLAGRIVAVLDRAEATESRVGALMTGAETA
jgi:general nucleoside transport system ATP-binding protein